MEIYFEKRFCQILLLCELPIDSYTQNIYWQFMMFFAIVITYLTIDKGKVFFGFAMPLAVAITFLKFFLQVRNEKNTK